MLKKQKYHNVFFTFFLFIISCSSPDPIGGGPLVVSTAKDLNVNLDINLQTMENFGASDAWQCNFIGKNWPTDKKNRIADLLFSKEVDGDGNPKGIGLSLWRFNLGAGSSEQGNASNIANEWRRTECFTTDGVTYDMSKQAGQVWFMKAAKQRGVEKLLAFTNSAPVYLTNNGKAYANIKEFYNLKDGKMPELADFWVNSIDKLQTVHGLTIDYISPFNEPQLEWDGGQEGSPATNANIYSFVTILSPKLKSKGLNSQIVLGEAGSFDYLYRSVDYLYRTVSAETDNRSNQIDFFFGVNSTKNIAEFSNVKKTISGHSYGQVWPLSTLIGSRYLLAAKAQTVLGLSLWASEYCVMERPGTDELPGDGGYGRDLGMKTALWVARIINSDIAIGGVTSWQWWTAISRVDYKDGLIHVDDGVSNGAGAGAIGASNPNYCKNDGYIRETKILWALGNFSFFIKPGMVRVQMPNIDNSTATTGVMMTAYKDIVNKKLVIVAVNFGTSAITYKLNLSGGTLRNNNLTPYTTSDTSNLKKGTDVDASNFEIEARSVVTFVGSFK